MNIYKIYYKNTIHFTEPGWTLTSRFKNTLLVPREICLGHKGSHIKIHKNIVQ